MIRRSKASLRRKRAEQPIIASVRQKVAIRDGFCRLMMHAVGPCQGRSEWCHFEEKRRWKTRGQPPEERHTTAGSCTLCAHHHRLYDAHVIKLQALSEHGCDGPLRVWLNDMCVFAEGLE